VSGAVQHTTGMNASGKVLAVNRDRNALIFRYADIGVVGDWEEFADRLILEAEQKRQQQ
jgi:electron transfer flavoprotein alpha subunit